MYIRYGRSTDLPTVLQWSALNHWEQLPAGDRARAPFPLVAQAAHQQVMGVLSSPGSALLVAEYQGQPVGYLILIVGDKQFTGEMQAYYVDIFIHPAFRRQGLGKAFHQAAEAHSRQLGATEARLYIASHNQPSQLSAAKAGFQVEGLVLSKCLQ